MNWANKIKNKNHQNQLMLNFSSTNLNFFRIATYMYKKKISRKLWCCSRPLLGTIPFTTASVEIVYVATKEKPAVLGNRYG